MYIVVEPESLLAGAVGVALLKIPSSVRPTSTAMEYRVATDGILCPRSMYESKLDEIPTRRATPRRVQFRASRASRSFAPIADAVIDPSAASSTAGSEVEAFGYTAPVLLDLCEAADSKVAMLQQTRPDDQPGESVRLLYDRRSIG